MKARWIELVVGAFVLASPWLLGFSDITLARWGNVICGLILILVSVWELYGTPSVADQDPVAASGIHVTRKSKNNKSRETI
jgi:hypothetical protein